MNNRKGFKAFEPGMICRGKQYAENTIFEEENAIVCETGMHYCVNPLDVLHYYPLIQKDGSYSEFAEVESLEEPQTDDRKKFCTKKLKIGAKIAVPDLIRCAFKITRENIESEARKKSETLKSGGNDATLAGGNDATLAGGNYSTLAGGDRAALASGNCSTLAGGNDAALAGGDGSVIVSGDGSIARGGLGSLIVFFKRDVHGRICEYKAEVVDGKNIKADTAYKWENGEFVEVKRKNE